MLDRSGGAARFHVLLPHACLQRVLPCGSGPAGKLDAKIMKASNELGAVLGIGGEVLAFLYE